jgi:hypothetical protein
MILFFIFDFLFLWFFFLIFLIEKNEKFYDFWISFFFLSYYLSVFVSLSLFHSVLS